MSENSTSSFQKRFSLLPKRIKWTVNRPWFLNGLMGRLILSFTGITLLVIIIGSISVWLNLRSLQSEVVREAEISAKMIALAIARDDENKLVPTLLQDQQSLQDFVEDLHRLEGRDIEIIDPNRTIKADVFPQNVGNFFEGDMNNEVGQTLKDGATRTFIEISEDYPEGVRLLVVPLRREHTDEIIGAVLFEYTPLYKNLLISRRNSIYSILMASLICVALATVIGHQTSKSISVPLRKLREAAMRIKQGDLETKIELEQEDEIGELASAFRAMSKNLKETIQTLQTEVVERREAEETVKQSEERFRALIENSADGITLLDANGISIYDSPAAPRMLGYDPGELLGRNVFELIHADDLPDVMDLFQNVVKSYGSRATSIFRFRHKDGSWRWLEAVVTNLLNEPAVEAIVANYKDVTEQKQAEETLRESEDRYRDLVNNSQDLICTHDLDGRILSVNPYTEQSLGYPTGALLNTNLVDILKPGTQKYFDRYLSTIQRNGLATGTMIVQTTKGEQRIWEYRNTLRTDGVSSPVVRGMARDVTEQKQAEEKILTLSRFPDENPNPVLRLSPIGRILYANKASQPLLGFWGRDDNQTLPDEWQRHVAEVFASGLNKEVEIQRAGQIFSCILSPVREEGYINFYGIDITERKQAEAALLQSEDRYRTLFEDSPISIWEEDFSGVKQRFNLLRQQGITDFKTYLSSHPELVIECASLVHIVDVNKAAMDLLQAKRKEDLLINLVEVLDQEGLKRFQDELMCIADGRSQYDWEGSNQTLTGQRIDIRGSWSVVPGHEDDLSKVIISLIDITERKQAELAVREAKNHYRLLVERLPAVTYIISSEPPYKTLYISPQIEQVLGFTSEEWLADPDIWERQIYPEDRERVLAEDIASREENRPFMCEYRIFRRDGRLIWLHDETYHIHEPDVQPYSQGIEFDITERKKAEAEIQTRTSELSTLYGLSRALADEDDLDKILELISRHAVESIHSTFARIVLLEGNKFVTRAVYPVRFLGHDLLVGNREPITSLPFCQHVLEQNEPVILHTHNQDILPEERAVLLLDFAQSLCLVPLRIGGPVQSSRQVLGLLLLGEERNEKREPFTPDKLRLAQSIGDQAAIAIRRRLLHEQTERRLDHLSALREIDQVIASSIGLHLSLGALLSQVNQQLKVDASAVWIFNSVSNMLVYSAGRGFRSKAFEQAKPHRLGEGYVGRAALERRIIHISNLSDQDDNPRLMRALENERFISYYGVPLIAKGTIKGVLEVFHRTPLEPDEEWLDFLNTLAGQGAIAIDNATLFENLQHSKNELSIAYDETIEGWSRALDLRDKETEGHTQRVTETTIKLARLFGLNEEEIIQVRRGALLHDIGKMGVPDGILLKPGPLTDDEWVIMRQHPQFAFDMLSPIYYLKSALDIPYCHHEKWDGSGYPRGLKGEEIPLEARIFAVVDVWDALTSDRPYRPAWPEKKVLEYIQSQAGIHFDPQVVEVCLTSGILVGKR